MHTKSLPSEKTLITADGNRVVLTTHRIRTDFRTGGSVNVQSIMLEHITSCEIAKKSYPILLVIAVLSAVFGILAYSTAPQGQSTLTVCLVVTLVLLVIYFATKRVLLSISSPSTSISIQATSIGLDKAREFVDEIEHAKNERYFAKKEANQPLEPTRMDD